MFEKLFLDNFARKLQKSEYNKSEKVDALIPNYIDGIINCLNGYITRFASNPDENTFQQLAEGNGVLCAELDDKSKKNKVWSSFFAIGVLANHRQQQIDEESPETEYLKQIIDGLQQIWGEGFVLMGLPPKLNQVAVNKVLTGMEKWVGAFEIDKPSSEAYSKEVIVMAMLVNVFESSLQENKSQVESYLPSAFSTLANIKKILILKNPELSMSILKTNIELLKAFLDEQPAIAQTIFSKNKSLVQDLACTKPVPDSLRAFLEKRPEFACALLERNQPELNDIIVPILLIKAPQHIDSVLTDARDSLNRVLAKDNKLLDTLLREQPALALQLFRENISFVNEWLSYKRAPESFRKLLENNPQFALELIKSDQIELKELIVSTVLAKAPEHIGTLITDVPDLVNKILRSDRALLHTILDWWDSAAAKQLDSRDTIDVFMGPFKIKSTADILFSLQTKKAAPTFMEALDSAEQSYKNSKKYLELVARQKRLNAFRVDNFEGLISSSFDDSAFWLQYPSRAAIDEFCDDLGLASNSPQRAHLLSHLNVSLENVALSWTGGLALISAGLSYFNTTFNPKITGGIPTLESIITSDAIQAAKIKAERKIEAILSGYSILDKQLASVKERINALDSSLKELSIEEWILTRSNFAQLAADSSKMLDAAQYMDILLDTIDKYKQELDKLVLIVKSIDKLGGLGVDVHNLLKSLEQYIEAVYQQGQKQLYGPKPEDYSERSLLGKLKFLANRLDIEIEKITKSEESLINLWENIKISSELLKLADKELMERAKSFVEGAKEGCLHRFLHKYIYMVFFPNYRSIFNCFTTQVAEYTKNPEESEHRCAEAIRNELTIHHSRQIPIKDDIEIHLVEPSVTNINTV